MPPKRSGIPGCFQFRASFLLHCIVYAFELKNSTRLAMTLRKSLRLMSPIWEKAFDAALSAQAGGLPSAATMHRSKQYVDAGYMMYWRDKHKELIDKDTVFVGLIDSSPHGSEDWEMFEYFAIHGDVLLNAADWVFELAQRISGFEHFLDEDDGELPDLDRIKHLMSSVSSAMNHHIFPPQAMASGTNRSTSRHVLHCILRACRLESHDWPMAKALLDRFFFGPLMRAKSFSRLVLAASSPLCGFLSGRTCDLMRKMCWMMLAPAIQM